MLQVGGCQPDFHTLSDMLHRIGKNNFRILVVLEEKNISKGFQRDNEP